MWLFDRIKTVPDIVRYWASKTPDKIALTEGATRRSYEELDRRSNRLANRMRQRGIAAGSNVGFLGRNSIAFYEVWFAANKIGCAIVPFNWRSAAEELVVLLNDARPAIVFVSAEFLDVVKMIAPRIDGSFEIVPFDAPTSAADRLVDWIGDCDDMPVQVPLAPSDVALVTYTSGTTGRPKGGQSTHETLQYCYLSASLEPTLSLSEADVMLMVMPNFHLSGTWFSLCALYHGGTIAVIPAFEPEAFLAALRRDRPTIVPLVPTILQLMLSRPDFSADDYASVRTIMYFGSSIGQELLNLALKRIQCEFNQYYGTTEGWLLTILNHSDHMSGVEGRLASCGAPLPLVAIKVVDAAGREVPNGTVGELLVRSPMVFAGYFRQPEVTAQAMQDGWYRTGDLGRCDDDGYFYIVDRAKDMIISGGENVYSAEVEGALLKHHAVATAAVIGIPDPVWGEKVTALVILAPNAQIDESSLKQHCRTFLAGYKVPKEIRFESALPMTPTGKVQKGILRQRFRTENAQ